MPVSTRIYGAKLTLKLGTVDYAADIKSYELSFKERETDDLTFGEAMLAGDEGTLKITAIQSTDTASFWAHVWANANTKAVAFTLAPHGNVTATATQPHVTGKLDIGPRPTLGGEAGPASYSFEVEWKCEVDAALKTT